MKDRFFPMTSSDGYKVYHTEQYPDECARFYGNLTARSDRLFTRAKSLNNHGKYVAFGMQQAMAEIIYIFDEHFFKRSLDEVVDGIIYKTLSNYIGADDSFMDKVRALHAYNRLPLVVLSVDEGDLVDINDPCMLVYTEYGFDWFFGFMEPMITSMIWKTMTNANTALELARLIKLYGNATGVDPYLQTFLAHDFSSRGLSGMEDAARSGTAHLLYFDGTENLGALKYIESVYNYDYEREGPLAGSIRATEHTVSSTNIFYEMERLQTEDKFEAESAFFKRYITEVYPTGMVAYVADTFDFFRTITEIMPKHKDAIMARDGKLVIRPDSFKDVVKGLVGDTDIPLFLDESVLENGSISSMMDTGDRFRVLDKLYEVGDNYSVPGKFSYNFLRYLSEEDAGALPLLFKHFGWVKNESNYYELPPQIGLIYGDGIDIERIDELYNFLSMCGIAISNIVIGVGAGLYQWVSRDTLGIAYKVTAYSLKGSPDKFVPVFKDPKGSGKRSARGIFQCKKNKDTGNWEMEDGHTEISTEENDMKILYMNGFLKEESFKNIRDNARRHVYDLI